MPSALETIVILTLAAGFAYIALVVRKLYCKCSADQITPDWLESFSVSTYLPMETLLNEEDFTFLSRQPGFDMSLYRKLRRDRLQIFRQYLDHLIVDFNRLHVAARVLLAITPEDHSGQVLGLIKIRIRFGLSLLQTEFRYRLCLFGLRTLPVRGLILGLEEMSAQLTAISSAQLPAA